MGKFARISFMISMSLMLSTIMTRAYSPMIFENSTMFLLCLVYSAKLSSFLTPSLEKLRNIICLSMFSFW